MEEDDYIRAVTVSCSANLMDFTETTTITIIRPLRELQLGIYTALKYKFSVSLK